MAVSIQAGRLRGAVTALSPVIKGKKSLPVLKNALLEWGNGKLTITATDIETYGLVTLPATTDGPGAVTVPASPFADVLETYGDSILELDAADRRLEIREPCRRSSGFLAGTDAADFPPIPEPEPGAPAVSWQPDALAAALASTRPYTAAQNAQPLLTYVHLSDTGAVGASNDGTARIATDTDGSLSLLPSTMADTALRLLKATTAPVSVANDGSHVVISGPDWQLLTPTAQQQTPMDIREKVAHAADVLESAPWTLQLPRQQTAQAVKGAALFGESVRLTLALDASAPAQDRFSVILDASNEDTGAYTYTLDVLMVARAEEAQPITVKVAAKKLLAMLQRVQSPRVLLAPQTTVNGLAVIADTKGTPYVQTCLRTP